MDSSLQTLHDRVLRWLRSLAFVCLAVLASCDGPGASPEVPAIPALQESSGSEKQSQGRSNIVLVTIDTTRADAIGAYGQALPVTPNLDRMASEGVLFEACASSSPSTLPSHATILTGQLPVRHGVRSNAGHQLPSSATTLAELLRARGYATAAEIAAPVLNENRGLAQGFDVYRDLRSADIKRASIVLAREGESRVVRLDERDASDITLHARRFLERVEGPFFLWLHYFDPHVYYAAPRAHAARISESAYHAEVSFVDAQIGLVIAALRARGIHGETLVVVTADHGEGLGEHGEETHAFYLYETTLRVPLVFWGHASLARGLRVPHLVRTVDLVPTIAEWAGISIPATAELDGVSLAPLLRGEPAPEVLRSLVAYGESIEPHTIFGSSVLRSLRVGPWKYIHKKVPELYDLSDDPSELRNLASDSPEQIASFQERLGALVDGAASALAPAARGEIDAEMRAQLAGLGYVVTSASVGSESEDIKARLGPDPVEVQPAFIALTEAVGLQQARSHREAAEAFSALVEAHPDSPPLLRGLIDSLLSLGAYAEAEPHLLHALELAPDDRSLSLDLARTWIALGFNDRAEALLAERIAAEPCAEEERLALGDSMRSRSDYSAARRYLEETLRVCDRSARLRNAYAHLLATAPDAAVRAPGEAVRLGRELIDEQPDDPRHLRVLGLAHAADGHLGLAESSLRRALSLARESNAPAQSVMELASQLATIERGEAWVDGNDRAVSSE